MQQDVVTVGVDREERVSGPRDRRGRQGANPPAAPAGRGAEVLLGVTALSRRHGIVSVSPSLGRELIALGHDVRLMPPVYVKP